MSKCQMLRRDPRCAIFVLVFILSGCGGKSEQDLIRDTVAKIGNYAESRNGPGILYYLSDDYSDDEGRTPEDIGELLEKYFDRYRGIVVNVLGTKIVSLKVPEAEIETEVALSSGAAKIFRKAVRYASEFYRFNLSLVKEGETWKCRRASWENLTLQELFPESTKILRKLFPQLF